MVISSFFSFIKSRKHEEYSNEVKMAQHRAFNGKLGLPDEVWLYILSFLDPSDILSLSQTCSFLHRLSGDDEVWKCACNKMTWCFDTVPPPFSSWKVFGCMKRIASWRYIRSHSKITSTDWNGPDTNVVKSVMLGDCGVGKTCMLMRIATPSFFQRGFCDSSSTTPCFTVGLGFHTLLVSAFGREIKLKVWDTSGQERFDNITSSFLKGAGSYLIVYDVTRADTFLGVERWRKMISEAVGEDYPILLAGLKTDETREVSQAMAIDYAMSRGMAYTELSTKAMYNVDLPFLFLAIAGSNVIQKPLIPLINDVVDVPLLVR